MLLLVGDIEADAAIDLVRQHFAAAPRRSPPPSITVREPLQTRQRRLQLLRQRQNPVLHCAYHALDVNDPLAPALSLLHTVLLGGDASRLHRALVEEQELAVQVEGGWSPGFDPSLFVIQATLPAAGSLSAVEQALDSELARLTSEGVTPRELRRAQNIAAVDFWREVSTIEGKARLLGEYAVLHGDYRRLFAAPAVVEQVTREQVLAAARAVFDPRQRTLGVLKPRRRTGAAAAARAAHQ